MDNLRNKKSVLIIGVSAFPREAYIGRIGSIIGTLESVRIIEVSALQGCLQGGVPLYFHQPHQCGKNSYHCCTVGRLNKIPLPTN